MDSRALLALLFTVAVWGVGPVFIRSLSVDLGPASHLVIRYGLVTMAYLAGLAVMGGWRIDRQDWPRLIAISFIGLAGYNLGAAFGFELVSAGVGSLIFGTEPLLIAVLGALAERERLSLETILGLAIALAGTALLVWGEVGLVTGGTNFVRGCLMVFLGAAAYAVYVVLSKPLILKYGSYSIAALSTSLCTLVLLVLLARPATIAIVATMTSRNWFDMAYVVILSTFISSITWNYGSARLPAATAGAFFYFMPVIGVIAGAILLGETITFATLIGGGLILVGVAIVQFGPLMRRTQLE
jgi:drug/metabolite transporter (DMT)-like permease